MIIQNKYIVRLSFIGLFLNIVANILIYRYFMIEEVIVKHITSANEQIAGMYQKHVWDKHPNAIAKLKTHHYKELLQDDDCIKFIQNSVDFFAQINAKVTLFDMYGNKFISNTESDLVKRNTSNIYDIVLDRIDRIFLPNLIADNPLERAFEGQLTNVLWRATSTSDALSDDSNTAFFIVSHIPIIDNNLNDFVIDGILEINTNITAQWTDMAFLQQKVFWGFIVVFSIFFVIVTYNTSYAQRIINQQSETNRDLEEAKIRAETESSAKTQFLANVSHELRTPLNAIIGFSEIMISRTYGAIENKQYNEYICDINNSGKHLLSVINDILDFSKASVDKLKVENVEIDLNKLASSSMRFVKPRADEANVKLIIDIPKDHIIIKADPKRLKQALLNLLSNAVKFTSAEGSITLGITQNHVGREVYIKVADTGIGMSEKDIPRALSTFGQIDNKFSRKYEGTGLGLPLTKKLVELMQGKFEIYSEVGIGTTVTLTFKYEDSIVVDA